MRVPRSGVIPFMSKLFPITPIEIHRGWILAQERLITKYTGTYSWGYPVSGTLYRYNSSGGLVDAIQSSIPTAGAVVTVPSNGLAVFIRDDLGAEPTTCQEVWQQGYGMAVDLDRNCRVDWGDFAVFAGDWLGVGCVVADFNDDCSVDWGDFAVFAASWLACNDPQNMPPCIATW